jgi:hypothetical protein
VLRAGDCVQERLECPESRGTVLSVQPSISFGEDVQYCEVDFNGKRRWILSLNLVRKDDLRISEPNLHFTLNGLQ